MSKFPVSHSRLSNFEQCPLKFELLYIDRSVKDTGSEHSRYGDRVHEALAAYCTTGNPQDLTAETARFRPAADRIRAIPGDRYCEYQMAVDEYGSPCDWFDSRAWLRGIADVLVVDGTKARCFDWKTGKVRAQDLTQLQLFATLIQWHFPEVTEVLSAFVWLKESKVTPLKVTREPGSPVTLWQPISDRLDALQTAVDLGVFEHRKSGLCGWCPAKHQGMCPYG